VQYGVGRVANRKKPAVDRFRAANLRGGIALTLVLLATSPPLPAPGQTFADVDPRLLDRGPLLLELPASTRGLALGGAWAGDDTDAIFHHPALVSGSGASLAHQGYGGAASLLTLTGGVEWLDGAVGLGLAVLEHAAPTEALADLRRDEASLIVGGDVGASAFVASGGYARELAWGFRGGAAAKVVGIRLGSARATAAAVDVGLAGEAGPVTLALSAQNLGPELELDGQALPLAHRIILGAFTQRRPVGPLDLGLAAHVTRDGSGDVLPGGGLEVAWWPVVGRTFLARIGVRRVAKGSATPLTLGGGFAGDRIRIDYGFQRFDGLDGSHRFGIAFR